MHALATDPIDSILDSKQHHPKSKKKSYKKLRQVNASILQADMEILETLEVLRDDLAYCHTCLDQITDPVLIDSYIFEIQALNKRYEFYLNLCRERGLMADMKVS